MSIRCLLADRWGRVLAEIEPGLVDTFPWQLNKPGKTTFTISRKDAKATKSNLQYGNLVYFEFDNGLPAWAGTIEPPRKWTGDTIQSTVQTIDFMLSYRITGKARNFYNTPVGGIFQAIIAEAQQVQSLNIGLGSVWMGGNGHSPRYHFKDVATILSDSLHKMEGCDYRFVPQLADGRVAWTAELHAILGTDKSNKVALVEGVNVSSAVLEESGPVINSFTSVGVGSTWGPERPTATEQELTSIQDLRLREASDVFIDVSTGATLQSHSQQQVKENAFPHLTFALEVSNTSPAEFGDYDVGDVIRLILPSYSWDGYDHSIRVTVREFDPSTGKCGLVVEEPTLPVLSTVQEEIENG